MMPYLSDDVVAQTLLMASSYHRLTGRELLPESVPNVEVLARALWEAPFALVSHGTEADPIFNYGNRTALNLFGMTWAEFVELPSRLSAEPLHRDERARLLDAVSLRGFIDDYSGIRIAKDGRRFRILNAVVWNLVDAQGCHRGQAATFGEWEPL